MPPHKKKSNHPNHALIMLLFGIMMIISIGIIWYMWASGVETNSANIVTSEVASIEEKKEPLILPQELVGLPAREERLPLQNKEGELVLRSVGDTLIHDRVSVMADVNSEIYRQSVEKRQLTSNTTDAYDFMPMVAQVAPYTQYADVTIANLEVLAASPQIDVAGYPQFSAPKELLTTLKAIGVDIVSNATNHTLDWFSEGAHASIANLKEAGLQYVGSFDSYEDQQTPRIIEKNGIKLGFLAYSYGTNGIPVPEDEPYLINLIDVPSMVADVEALKSQVDAVVVSLQLGPEYDTMPNEDQTYVFQALSDAGVKLILGGHPHVLQPVDWINEGKTFAIYSQASFISGQREAENKQGGITEVTFKRQSDGEVVVTAPKFMPLYMLGIEGESLYETVPLADYMKYEIVNGNEWWQILKERMSTFTSDYQYVSHLSTEWTYESPEVFR